MLNLHTTSKYYSVKKIAVGTANFVNWQEVVTIKVLKQKITVNLCIHG